jgi:hypothetical protein
VARSVDRYKLLAGEVRDGDVVRVGFDADRGVLTFNESQRLRRLLAERS